MAGKTLTSSLVVRLIDKVSGPAKSVSTSINNIAKAARQPMTMRLNAAIEANNQALSEARMGLVDAVASFYTFKGVVQSSVKAAMDFESAMSDVRKVVDFPTPKAFEEFKQSLLDMSKKIPMSVQGLAQMAAAAGQAGIATKDILKFTEGAAKIGVAFDISADIAGDSMAKMMTGLGLTIDQTILLADAMNHLSDAQASNARDILDVVRRVGAQSKQFGFDAVQVSAFASAMLSAGAQSDVAATSFRNMGLALTKGGAATKAQRRAFRMLGMDSIKVSKAMQKDAVGTTLKVLEAIGKLPKDLQASVSSELFGNEAHALGPLLTNLDLLKKSLGLVKSESDYAGSAFREYEIKAKDFANVVQKFNSTFEELKIMIGNALLPALTSLMGALGPVIESMSHFAKDHPQIVAGVMAIVGALTALKLSVAGLRFIGLMGKGGILSFLNVGLMGAEGAAAGGAWGKAFGLAARAAVAGLAGLITAEVLQALDPKGNLGGLTGGLDNLIRDTFGLKHKDGGVTPGEIFDGIKQIYKEATTDNKSGGLSPTERDEGKPRLSKRAIDLGFDKSPIYGAVDDAVQKAKDGATEISSQLGVTVTPKVDPSSIDAAKAKVDALGATLRNLGAAQPAQAGKVGHYATPAKVDTAGHRANGGNVWPGSSFLVGEKQPEVFTPQSAGKITPISKAGGAINAPITVHVHGFGGDARDLAREIKREITNDLERLLRGANADMAAR